MIHYEKIAAAVLAMQCMGYFRIWGAVAKESVASIRYGFRAIYDPSGSTCLVKSKRMARIRRNLQYWWDWLEDRTAGSCSSLCNQFARGVWSMLGAVTPDSFDTLHSYTNTFQMPFVTPWFPEKVS
ncbi:unnamed protein product [Plutella xylostella]|uniref:(diamondback moth) hypothetical protein n=1 Tax=Plutella xylostella TaxID=51655 RepID=A0A8S4GAU0_PLUXY|nr:unnamed protein product [Plutella xylostella]